MLRSSASAIIALALATPASLLAWGQPTHGAISYNVIERFGSSMPRPCTDAATRDTYLHASYSPDQYVLQGPEYVHLDRQFSLLLFKHAKDARQLALAYGWSTHQEEDTVGHGRYITETGMTHLMKELIMDSRFLFEGSSGEARTVRRAGSAWDAGQIEAASLEYSGKYGTQYKGISKAMANTTGYVFTAYMAAVKGVLYALWYGRVKWKKDLYPRSQWQGFVEESIEQTHKWCRDPFSFGASSQDMARAAGFGAIFKDAAPDEVSTKVPEAEPVSTEETMARLSEAMKSYEAEVGRRPVVKGFGKRTADDSGSSHVMLQQMSFVKMGEALLKSRSMTVSESAAGDYHHVRSRVTNKRQFMKDMESYLSGPGSPSKQDPRVAGGAKGPLGDLFDQIAKDCHTAVGNVDETPEE